MNLFFHTKSNLQNFILSCSVLLLIIRIDVTANDEAPPNVLIIMTDEHNLRTLGCYRDLMVQSQAEIWGEGITVATPNLDSLAKDGALFSNYLTVSPVCTPSRGSFMTGTYPSKHGAIHNQVPMNDDAITFAQILKDKKLGYSTSYMGKWHLNGELISDEGFGAPEDRSFGFDDTTYQWDRGHWKFIQENDDGSIKAYPYKTGITIFDSPKSRSDAYSTDFLTNRAIKYINIQAGLENPFILMVSYPDPHNPYAVREPYNEMFDDLHFAIPQSAISSLNKKPAPPAWSRTNTPEIPEDTPLDTVEREIELYENSASYQRRQRQTFGMIKLLDDNIGRILETLKNNNLENNTLVIFTSDHGGTMAEHNSRGKETPYKTSAGVPFLIRWPGKIPAGKHVETAYSSIDFVPTLLNLLGIDTSEFELPGIDASGDLLNEAMHISDESQIRFIENTMGKWTAAMSQRYKLVLGRSEMPPYLFDTTADPNELTNFFYLNKAYKEVSQTMKRALNKEIKTRDFQLREQQDPVYLVTPACQETRDQLDGDETFTVCANYKTVALQEECQKPALKSKCPVTCNVCFKDTRWGNFMWKRRYISCASVASKSLWKRRKWCKKEAIGNFCRETCADFL